jgi:hypothetical protein
LIFEHLYTLAGPGRGCILELEAGLYGFYFYMRPNMNTLYELSWLVIRIDSLKYVIYETGTAPHQGGMYVGTFILSNYITGSPKYMQLSSWGAKIVQGYGIEVYKIKS